MGVRSILITIFYSIKLLFISIGIAIRFYFKRRKAKSLLKRELVASGLSKREADEIAEAFPFKMRDIFQIFRAARS
jgi:hypothetical protein